ncbi:MAG: tetratricopeptide repeat protein [Candidatus Palauibacterales bacterium]|nr:tetratricopeptide repeat protein [Candidatus Palauibacterales bacterium]
MSGPMKLLDGLKQRSVWQVLAVYLGVSWVALQVVDLLKQNMGLPDWVFPFAIVLLVIGLPIILATAMLQGRPGGGTPAGAPAASEGSGPETSKTPAPHASSELAPRRLFTWRNAMVGGGLAFALLAVVTTGFMFMRNRGIGPVGSLVAKGLIDERSPVILADFVADDEGLSRAATEAFRVDLSQTRIVKVAERSSLEPTLERMQVDPEQPLTETVAREAAAREGIPAVIAGEITKAGSGYVLTARVVKPEGTELASHRETARDDGEIIPAIDRLSGKIREKIGESFSSLRADAPLAAVTTSSLEALELYSEALDAIDRGDSQTGIRLLEEAVEIDPEFASAWRKLGTELSNRRQGRARATEALERAYELRDRLTPRERYLTEATYFYSRFDETRAIAAYERMLDLDPNDGWALNNLSLIYGGLGEDERALELLQRAIAVDTNSITLGNVAERQAALGRFDEAAQTIAAGRRLFPDDPQYYFGAARLAEDMEDYDRALAVLDTLATALPANARAQAGVRFSRAGIAQLRGRLADAAEQQSEGREILRQMGRPGANYDWGSFWMTLEFRRDTAAARDVLDEMFSEHPPEEIEEPLDRPYIGFANAYAAVGQADEARAMIAAFREAVPDAPDDRWTDDVAELEGLAAFHEGRYEEAIDHFLELRRLLPGCEACGLREIGEVHDAAGRADSAIVWYLQELELPNGRAQDRPFLFERLGQLYDEQGDLENAAVYYARFVELWEDADPELRPRVEAARGRLQEIVRERG